MASRRQTAAPEVETPEPIETENHNGNRNTFEFLPNEQLDQEEDNKLADLMRDAELNQGRVSVFRRREGQSVHSWVGHLPLMNSGSELFEAMKKKFGGGDFLMKFLRSNGQVFRGARITIEVDETPAPVAGPATVDHTELYRLLEKLQGGDKSEKMMLMMMDSQAKLMAALLPALVSGRNSGNNGPSMLELLQCVKELQPPRTAVSELVENFRAMKQISNGEDPEEPKEREDGMFEGLIKAATPLLANAMERMATPRPAGPAPQGTPQPQQSRLPFGFKMVMTRMIQSAQAGGPPETWVDTTFNMMDAATIDGLAALLIKKEWPDIIFSDPQCIHLRAAFETVRPWFEEYRATFLDDYKAQQPPVEAPAPAETQAPPA